MKKPQVGSEAETGVGGRVAETGGQGRVSQEGTQPELCEEVGDRVRSQARSQKRLEPVCDEQTLPCVPTPQPSFWTAGRMGGWDEMRRQNETGRLRNQN